METATKPPEKKPHKPYNRTYDRNKVKALATIGVKATDIAKAVELRRRGLSFVELLAIGQRVSLAVLLLSPLYQS